MVYRAKITHIRAYIESIYNLNKYHQVHDSKDWYIEVRNEDEAELIEAVNSAQLRLMQAVNNHRKFLEEK